MLKKIIAVTFCIAVLLSFAVIVNAEGITWEFNNSTNVLAIKGSGEMTEAPWNDDVDVTKVKKIVIEEGITSICDNAFCIFTEDGDMVSYGSLEVVEIPQSVTKIGVRAFAWAEKLTSVQLPSNLKELGMTAFVGTGITHVTIPATLVRWDITAFAYCANLNNVTISDGLTTIPDYTFYGCEALTGVTIPDSVVKIGGGVFQECINLEWVEIPYGVVSIGEEAFNSCNKLTSLVIPASVKELSAGALYNYDTDKIIYRGTKAQWDKIKKGEGVISENTELVCNNEDLAFELKVEGEQVSFSWNEIPGVLSYSLSIFKDDEYVTGTEINEIYGDMEFVCFLEDGKYSARLMMLTADFSGGSEFIDFYVGNAMLSETYALTTLKGEMVDGKFYAEAEIVERYDRSEMDMYIIAVYHGGVMLDMVYVTGDLIPGQSFKFGGMLEGCDDAELKAFVWDNMEGMQTLSNVVQK